jgi:hypothetical protein
MSTPLFEEFLAGSDTLWIYDEGRLIFASSRGGVLPLVAYLADHGPRPRPVTLFDKVMGNAAALLSVRLNSRKVYSPLGSRLAVETLERYGIGYHLDEIVPFIRRADGEGMCPMEALSLGMGPGEFYEAALARLTNQHEMPEGRQTDWNG